MLNKLILSLTFFSFLFVSAVYAQRKSQKAQDLPPRGSDQAQTDTPADEVNVQIGPADEEREMQENNEKLPPSDEADVQIESVDEEGEMQGNNKELDFKVTDDRPLEDAEDEDEVETPGRGRAQGRGLVGMQAIQEYASPVAKHVQALLNSPDLEGQGIGQQVQEVARAQNQAQERIQEHVQAIEARGKIMRFFLGSNKQAVKGLEKQLRENKDRLARLEELANEAPTEDIQAQIQAAQSVLQGQNEALDQAVVAEKQVKGIFSKILSLFK